MFATKPFPTLTDVSLTPQFICVLGFFRTKLKSFTDSERHDHKNRSHISYEVPREKEKDIKVKRRSLVPPTLLVTLFWTPVTRKSGSVQIFKRVIHTLLPTIKHTGEDPDDMKPLTSLETSSGCDVGGFCGDLVHKKTTMITYHQVDSCLYYTVVSSVLKSMNKQHWIHITSQINDIWLQTDRQWGGDAWSDLGIWSGPAAVSAGALAAMTLSPGGRTNES